MITPSNMTEAYFVCLSHNVSHLVIHDIVSEDDSKNYTDENCYFINSSIGDGGKEGKVLPEQYTVISAESWRCIVLYTVIFIVASIGNIYVLISVVRRLQKRPSPMNKLLLHLTIADLMVVFIVIPAEIAWRISIGWNAGDFMCKLVQYFRAFGLYLSSLILICISLDRYYVVVYPLSAIDANKRVRVWIILSWITSAVCSIPQVLVFREEVHPDFEVYRQCSSIWVEDSINILHTFFSLVVMYFLPLSVIIFTYSNIILTIQSQNTPTTEGTESSSFLRRSSRCVIERARIRALKLTFVIVLVFLICWTPYVIITLWHVLDRNSAEKLNAGLQDLLFTCVVANSSANPLVYLFFSRKSSNSRRATTSFSSIMEEEAAGEKPPTQTVVEVEPQMEKAASAEAVAMEERKKSGDKQVMPVSEPVVRPPTLKDFYVCLGVLLGLAVIFGVVIVAILVYETSNPHSILYNHELKDSEMTTMATTHVANETAVNNGTNTGTGSEGNGGGGAAPDGSDTAAPQSA